MKFGDRLRDLREKKGITQKELGEIINTSSRVIGYYESNDRFPKDENSLKILANYFGVSVDYLVGRTVFSLPETKYSPNSERLYTIDIEGLPSEAVKMIDDYIDLIKYKFKNSNKNK